MTDRPAKRSLSTLAGETQRADLVEHRGQVAEVRLTEGNVMGDQRTRLHRVHQRPLP